MINRVIATDPAAFLRVAAGLLPKEVELTADPAIAELLTDARNFAEAFRRLANFVGSELEAEELPLIEAEDAD